MIGPAFARAASAWAQRPLFEVGIERSILDENGRRPPTRLTQALASVDYFAAKPTRDAAFPDESTPLALPLATTLAAPAPAETLRHFKHRLGWLLVLLVLQSLSSVVLKQFETLIVRHPAIILFLTMLVGAGGNVGSQSTVLAVRCLSKGSFHPHASLRGFVLHELLTGAKLAAALAVVAVLRVLLFNSDAYENAAIGLSMFVIVLLATLLGTTLPLALWFFGLDPAHAGAAIQVAIDIVGVTCTCLLASLVCSLALSG